MQSIFQRLANGSIKTKHAIHEAFHSTPIAGFVPQLQANFAFTRAYLANEAGKKEGFGGSECYIDLALFESHIPRWITFSRRNSYNKNGLIVNYGQLDSFNWIVASKSSYSGIESTATIASKIGMGK